MQTMQRGRNSRNTLIMDEGRREQDRGTEREGTGLLSPSGVSGPFVVLFDIPQQTATGHMKRGGTKSRERAGVCACVFISTGNVHAPVSTSSHCTFAARIYGCSLSFCMTAVLFQPPISIQSTSHAEGGHGGQAGLQRYRPR